MNPNNNVGQDAASVAVLQTQIEATNTAVRDLARATQEGMAALNAKVDRLSELTAQLAQVSARQESQTDGLNRVVDEVRQLSNRMASQAEEATAWRERVLSDIDTRIEKHRAPLDAVQHSITQWRGVIIGAGVVFGLCCSTLAWVGGKYVTATESNSEKLQRLELRVEALHQLEARR
jgi:chromosome segregation ATPase